MSLSQRARLGSMQSARRLSRAGLKSEDSCTRATLDSCTARGRPVCLTAHGLRVHQHATRCTQFAGRLPRTPCARRTASSPHLRLSRTVPSNIASRTPPPPPPLSPKIPSSSGRQRDASLAAGGLQSKAAPRPKTEATPWPRRATAPGTRRLVAHAAHNAPPSHPHLLHHHHLLPAAPHIGRSYALMSGLRHCSQVVAVCCIRAMHEEISALASCSRGSCAVYWRWSSAFS